jgi:hypothetical protein
MRGTDGTRQSSNKELFFGAGGRERAALVSAQRKGTARGYAYGIVVPVRVMRSTEVVRSLGDIGRARMTFLNGSGRLNEHLIPAREERCRGSVALVCVV